MDSWRDEILVALVESALAMRMCGKSWQVHCNRKIKRVGFSNRQTILPRHVLQWCAGPSSKR